MADPRLVLKFVPHPILSPCSWVRLVKQFQCNTNNVLSLFGQHTQVHVAFVFLIIKTLSLIRMGSTILNIGKCNDKLLKGQDQTSKTRSSIWDACWSNQWLFDSYSLLSLINRIKKKVIDLVSLVLKGRVHARLDCSNLSLIRIIKLDYFGSLIIYVAELLKVLTWKGKIVVLRTYSKTSIQEEDESKTRGRSFLYKHTQKIVITMRKLYKELS